MVAHRREEKTVSVEIEHAASGTLLKHSIAQIDGINIMKESQKLSHHFNPKFLYFKDFFTANVCQK